MPKLEVEIADDGTLVGELPEALKSHAQKLADASREQIKKDIAQQEFNAGFQKGAAKKFEELKNNIVDPAEREKYKTMEKELEDRKIAELEQAKKYDEAGKIREERFQKELREKDEAIAARHGKLKGGALSEIKAMALKYGARDESLTELAAILGGEIDFDEKLDPFVKGADGKPAADAKGQLLTIEGRVRSYLDSHRHHLKGSGGAGGGALGGHSFDNLSDAVVAAQAKVDEAQKAFDANPRSNDALLALHSAQQTLAKAKTKG